jgi:hypothetical protein
MYVCTLHLIDEHTVDRPLPRYITAVTGLPTMSAQETARLMSMTL